MITILFLASNPCDTARLVIDEEVRAIDGSLRSAKFREVFDFKTHLAVQVSDLQELFLRHKPMIVHFSGHGSTSSEIILQDESGVSHAVPPQALENLFFIFRNDIRCVVLNACFSHKQGEAIAKHIDCVVGMTNVITDEAAIAFSSAFYQALAYGRSVKEAFDLGCNAIHLEQFGGEYDIPILLSKKAAPNTITFQPTPDLVNRQEQKSPPHSQLPQVTKQPVSPQPTSFIYCSRCGGRLGESPTCPNYDSHYFVEKKPNSVLIYCSRCGAVPGKMTRCPHYDSHNFVEKRSL